MNVNDSLKETINNSIEKIVIELISSQVEFSLVVSSRNWNYPLPERLKKQDYFIIQLKEQSLFESEFDGEVVIIRTQFDGEENSLVLYPEDVKAILMIDMQTAILVKPFNDTPKNVNLEKQVKLNSDVLGHFHDVEMTPGIQHSLDCFIKGNPNIFPV
jgi:hypothetical protein